MAVGVPLIVPETCLLFAGKGDFCGPESIPRWERAEVIAAVDIFAVDSFWVFRWILLRGCRYSR